jgi:two-component system LytT family response regulator
MSGRAKGPMRVLVVEDEPLARQRLRGLLDGIDWVTLVGEVGDGETAIEFIEREQPDLLLLDIHLPGRFSGLDVLEQLTYCPAVVLTTAHGEHALTAFELGAIDYVLKPFGRERLLGSLERAWRLRSEKLDLGALPRVREAFREPLRRIFVRDRDALVPIAVGDIEHIAADGDYARIGVAGRHYLVNVSLSDIEERLDGDRFLRIHRSHIINLDAVTRIVPFDGARLQIELRNGSKIVASRTRSKILRDLAM